MKIFTYFIFTSALLGAFQAQGMIEVTEPMAGSKNSSVTIHVTAGNTQDEAKLKTLFATYKNRDNLVVRLKGATPSTLHTALLTMIDSWPANIKNLQIIGAGSEVPVDSEGTV